MRKVPTTTPQNRWLAFGSSRKGAGEWWAERLSAIALVPLTIWFAASVIALTGSDHAALVAWLETPFATICMLLLLIALFYHTALGLQVIIEDYMHSSGKFAAIIATRLGCFALAVAGIVATLRIAFAG